MRHLSIILLCITIFHAKISAQSNSLDTISIEKRFLSADFNYQGKNLSIIKLEDLCEPFPDANDEIILAKKNNNPSILLTLVGAGLIGYTGIKWIMGDTPQWYFAAGGAVLIGATIPLYRASRNHQINAARIYNYEIKHLQKK